MKHMSNIKLFLLKASISFFLQITFLIRVIEHLWPSIGHFTALLLASLEPLIQKSLERFSLKDFKFDHVLLGNIPPKIGGIKCYGKTTSRNEIILDLEAGYLNRFYGFNKLDFPLDLLVLC